MFKHLTRLLLAVTACAQPPRSSPADAATPDTPAGRALAAWLEVHNRGDVDSSRAFATRAYAASELASRPAEVVARGHRLWLMNYGAMRVVRIDSSAPYSVEVLVHEALPDSYGKVFVEVDSAPQYGITGVWLISFVLPPPEYNTPRQDDGALSAALERYATRLTKAEVFSGALLVARKGRVHFSKAYGAARREPMTPNTLETRFELASLSKLFTAVSIAQLVEKGRLAFDSTVSSVLPDYPNPEAGRRITIHQLLIHTSGLPDFYRNGKLRALEDSIHTLRDFWRTFAQDSLWSEPGERYDYSNSNYVLLGSIIERVSGMPFEQFVQRHIFDPAGMTATCYCEPGAPNHATPYSRYTAGFGPSRAAVIERWVEVPAGAKRPGAPGGGGISTVGDLARFADALLTHRLLTPQMTALVLEPKVKMDGEGRRGYGFEVYDWSGTRLVGHGGNFWGTMSQLDIYPDSGYVVVVLSNNDASGGEAVRNWTRRMLTQTR